MIPKIRLTSQQLALPAFDKPGEMVAWMGAIQGQAYEMAKWAVGIRLKSPALSAVNEALARGEILRTHVMRPTWHLVAAQDIRWMVKLSAERIRAANDSLTKAHKLEISELPYHRVYDLLGRELGGEGHLTKQEVGEMLRREGIETDNARLTRFLMQAETEGIVCSGADKGGKPTYALLDQRAPHAKELPREEALGELARRYFQSHSPATLADFVWWSGLTLGDARKAVGSIRSQLAEEKAEGTTRFIHETCRACPPAEATGNLHLLPSFDEYLISYKDRTDVLEAQHAPKAFNNWGIFQPVILYRGRIVGNWEKTGKKKGPAVGTSFFEGEAVPDSACLQRAIDRYCGFMNG